MSSSMLMFASEISLLSRAITPFVWSASSSTVRRISARSMAMLLTFLLKMPLNSSSFGWSTIIFDWCVALMILNLLPLSMLQTFSYTFFASMSTVMHATLFFVEIIEFLNTLRSFFSSVWKESSVWNLRMAEITESKLACMWYFLMRYFASARLLTILRAMSFCMARSDWRSRQTSWLMLVAIKPQH